MDVVSVCGPPDSGKLTLVETALDSCGRVNVSSIEEMRNAMVHSDENYVVVYDAVSTTDYEQVWSTATLFKGLLRARGKGPRAVVLITDAKPIGECVMLGHHASAT